MKPRQESELHASQILVAEDSPTQADRLRHLLEQHGYEVTVASNGVDALAAAQNRPPALIISDILMPQMDGYTLCRQIKSQEKLRDIPVILFTSLSGPEELMKALECGADNFIRKPSEEGYLLARVAEILTYRDMRQSEKFQLGAEIEIAGQKHFITADRKQILSLLLSSFFEAIQANQELKAREKDLVDLNAQLEKKVEARTATLKVEIAEREVVEKALRQSEAQYRGLFENAPYGIYRSGPRGKFLDVNPALVRMLGYKSGKELLALDVARDLYRNPAAREKLIEQFRLSGSITGIEAEWKKRDGTPILVRLNGRALQDTAGELDGFEMIVEDITQSRTLEIHNRQLQKFEAIGQLAGGIAHDFNNVVGAMRGWAEIGRAEATPDSRLQSLFGKIHDQTERAAGLTRQLLAFARRQILEPRNVDLNRTVEEVTCLLRTVIGEHIELKMLLAPDLALVRADPTQLEQVIMNLCLNARDAMPNGGQVLVETANVEFDEAYCLQQPYARPGSFVLLSVTDTGMGMDAATIERIFEPFFTTKEMGKGTGLGLATVYGIVKQHGGFIHVYSEPEHGTTFRAYLPSTTGGAQTEKRAETGLVRGGTETILLAEDHDGYREIAQEILRKLGYTVLSAGNGEEAVMLFESNRKSIALVCLDCVMPKLGGPEAYRRMCAEHPNLPVIFATGYSAEAELLQSLMKEGAIILQKPYDLKALGDKVREVLDRVQPTPEKRNGV